MDIWMSGEIQSDVDDAYSEVRKEIETKLNTAFASKDFGTGLVKWYFIAMIFGEHGPADYKEISRYSKRDRTCEFRLIIDHESFRAGGRTARAALVCGALLRSLDLLSEKKVPDIDLPALRAVVIEVANRNGWLT